MLCLAYHSGFSLISLIMLVSGKFCSHYSLFKGTIMQQVLHTRSAIQGAKVNKEKSVVFTTCSFLSKLS